MFIIYETDNTHFILWVFMLVLSGLFVFNFNFSLKKSFLELVVLIYLLMAHTLVPILGEIKFLDININTLSFQNNLSIYLYITFFTVYFFFNKLWDYEPQKRKWKEIIISKKWLHIFFINIFVLSAISYLLGIGKMGGQLVELPFKLTGIINYSRLILAPFLFVILFDKIKDKETKQFLLKIIILFFLWCIFEAFVRLSRSAIIEYLIPFIIYSLLRLKISFFQAIKYILPLIILNFMLYPLITSLRKIEGKVTLETIESANQSGTQHQQGKIYFRIFGNAKFIERYIPYLSNDLFSFHNLPSIIAYRGSHHFTTVEVDGLYSIQNKHSSGTTGIGDALLIGGKGFAIITFAIISIIAIYLDSRKMREEYMLRIFGFTAIRWLIMLRSWSLLLSPIEIVPFVVIYYLIKKTSR